MLSSVQLHYINSRLNRILSPGDSHNPAPPRVPPVLTLLTILCESTKLRLTGGQHNHITQRGIRRVWQHFSLCANSEFRNAFKWNLFLKSFFQHAWTLIHVDFGYMSYTVAN